MSLTVPWLSYMVYDYSLDRLLIYFSEDTKQKMSSVDPFMDVEGDNIKDMIHKYDYRKLIYFSKNPLVQPFDTLLRIRWHPKFPYLRTQAICQSHANGFHCVLVEDKVLHSMYHLWIKEKTPSKTLILENDTRDSIGSEKEWLVMQHHLIHLFQKKVELINT
jgi:hypothetical protein